MVSAVRQRAPYADVVSLGEPEVLGVLDQLDVRELAAHGVCGAVAGRVVDDDHVGCRVGGGERPEAGERVLAAVPREDDGAHHRFNLTGAGSPTRT